MKLVDAIKRNPAQFGLVAWFTFMWSWALQTDSLDLAGNKTQGMVIAVLVLMINVGLSVLVAEWFLRVAKKIEPKIKTILKVPVLLVLFAFMDFMVAWIPAALWIGPQGRLDSVLPLGSASLILLRTPMIFATRLVGLYGLAAFVWTFLFLVFTKKLQKLSLIAAILFCLVSIIGWGMYKNVDGKTFDATLISETLLDRVPQIKPKNETLVIFPEYGLEKVTNKNLHERIHWDKKQNQKTYFAGSTQVYKENRMGHENRMLIGNTKDGIIDEQDKYRLIPGGEDLPFIVRTMLRATGQKSTLDYFSYAKAVIKGKHQLRPFNAGEGITVGIAVCSSIIAPQDYRAFTNSGATVLVNSASLKPFGGSRLFAWQQQTYARFMAVANSRYFLQSANSASAYAFDNNGKKLGEVRGVNTLAVTAKTNTKKTVYTRAGELMAWAGGILTAVTLLKEKIRPPNKKKKSKKN